MLAGALAAVARAALVDGAAGLARFRIELFRPIQPMLAQAAADVAEALTELGEAALEYKLDGARIQVHKAGDDVRVFSRQLNDVTVAVPEVVEATRRLPLRVASTTSGTATVTSFSWREKTRTSSPALCTWIRAPSSLYSNAASPSSVRASATSAAAWASIGWIGRNSSIRKRASPAAPSTSAARATAARSPASIAARRTKSGSSPAARATASVTSPSSAPCRSEE